MPNVVTYCRVSSDEQAEKDNSIPAQRKALHHWVAQNVGHQIVGEYVDEGVSAYAPADRRPGFCEMVSFCRKHDVDMIVVHKLDRFSRNREESILFKGLLRKHGVVVKSVSEQFDPESPQGFLYEGMIEVINQFYSMNLGTETLKGMRENASRGWVNGGTAPYGYARAQVKDAAGREHWTYVLGPDDEVEVVREIFRLSDEEGLGGKAIAQRLNQDQVPAVGGKPWRSSSIQNILGNPVYCGDLVWMRTKKKGRTGRTRTEEGEQVVVRDAHPAIIDREAFERRRKAAQQRHFAVHTSPHKSVNYLLGRLIRCGSCGSSFVGRRREYTNHRGERQTALAYYCSGYLYIGTHHCKSLPLDLPWLEGTVVDAIRARFVDAAGWRELERRVRQRLEARRARYGNDPKAVAGKLSEIDRKITNYYRAIGDGLDPEVCKGLISDLQKKKAEIEAEFNILQSEDYYTVALERNFGLLGRLRSKLGDSFEQLPFGVQRQVILAFVSEIEVRERREVVIKLRLALDNGGIEHLCDEVTAVEKGQWREDPDMMRELEADGDKAVAPYAPSGPKRRPRQDSNLWPAV